MSANLFHSGARALRLAILCWAGLVSGCASAPEGARPVEGFEVDRYLGRWFEIARFDHRFERRLSDVTATYAARADGGIDMWNRGWDPVESVWKETRAKAHFTGERNVAQLKVAYFGPFYGRYNVIALDRVEYRWALVCGGRSAYLWILAREPQLPEETLREIVEEARRQGFVVENLIYPGHGLAPEGT